MSTQEILKQNKCQTRFLDKSVFFKNVDQKLMINAITYSMFESTYNSDYYEIEDGIYKSTLLYPTIKM